MNRSQQNWKTNKVRGVANLLGNYADWLVSILNFMCFLTVSI